LPRALQHKSLRFLIQAGICRTGNSYRANGSVTCHLPLLRVLTISQFRAVLAHEFGHYYGGDTHLWPFVHKTRAAMARTLRNLGSDSLGRALARVNLARLVHIVAVTILVAYWKVFMRITKAISRLREYRADELASNIAGPQALIEGLSATHGASAAFSSFWRTEMRRSSVGQFP